MYKIENKTDLNLSIFGKVIPKTSEKINSIVEYFNKKVYNGVEQTEESLYKIIKGSFKGQKIVLKKIKEEPIKPAGRVVSESGKVKTPAKKVTKKAK